MTCGGLGLWALIDTILILTGSLRARDGSPLDGHEEGKRTATIIFIVLIVAGLAYGATTFSANINNLTP